MKNGQKKSIKSKNKTLYQEYLVDIEITNQRFYSRLATKKGNSVDLMFAVMKEFNIEDRRKFLEISQTL